MIALVGPLVATVALSAVVPPQPWLPPVAKQAAKETAALQAQCDQLQAEIIKLQCRIAEMLAEDENMQVRLEWGIKLMERREKQKPAPVK